MDKKIAERLGFEPLEFYFEISTAIEEHIDTNIAGLKKELATIAKNKGYKGVTAAILEECCRMLSQQMKATYGKNINKFGSYADRNIFVLPSPTASSAASSSQSSSELEQLTEEVERLRAKYVTLRQNHAALSSECRNSDLLLKDMRGALFSLRLGAQALENHQVQPLMESWAAVTQHRQSLLDLSTKAHEIRSRMHATLNPNSSSSSSSSNGESMEITEGQHAYQEEAIAMGSVEDMKLVHQQMQRGDR